jgi:hypothetical protein
MPLRYVCMYVHNYSHKLLNYPTGFWSKSLSLCKYHKEFTYVCLTLHTDTWQVLKSRKFADFLLLCNPNAFYVSIVCQQQTIHDLLTQRLWIWQRLSKYGSVLLERSCFFSFFLIELDKNFFSSADDRIPTTTAMPRLTTRKNKNRHTQKNSNTVSRRRRKTVLAQALTIFYNILTFKKRMSALLTN